MIKRLIEKAAKLPAAPRILAISALTLSSISAASAASITWSTGPNFGGPDGHLGILTNGALVEAKQQLDAAKRCGECGSVLEVKPRDIQGEGSGMGIAAGAVAGGLLGKQVGKGKGNTAATIAGALVGGYAGNEAEKALRSQKAYDYVIKLNNGQIHTIQGKEGETQPAFKIGDRVRFADGVLSAQ